MSHRYARAGSALVVVCLLFTTACFRNPERAKREHLERGNQYFGQKKYREAIIEYRSAIQQDQRFGEARLKLAEAYTAVNDLDNAFKEYVRAADLLPNEVGVQLAAGQLLLMARRFEDAKARADLVLSKHPGNVPAHLLKGNAIAGLKDLDGAIEEVRQAVQLEPGTAMPYLSLGGLVLAKGQRADAEAAFQTALSLEPNSARVHLALANFYWLTGRFDAAEAPFKRAVELEPRNLLANRALAAYYVVSRRLPNAEPYLRVIAAEMGDPKAQFDLADYYILLRRFPDAAAILEPLVSDNTAGVGARLRLAAIAQAEGQTARTHQMLDEILARAPNNAAALLAKGRLLIAEGKTTEGIVRLRAAVSADPGSAPGFYALGVAYDSQNDAVEAVNAFQQALKANPRAVGAQIQLARLALARGSADEAATFAAAAVAAAPGNVDAQVFLARAMLLKGEASVAEPIVRRLLGQHPDVAVVHSLAGSLYARQRRPVEAGRAFERALKINANLNEAVAGLVGLDLAAGNPRAAVARLEARMAAAPADPQVLLLAAHAYLGVKDASRAEGILKKLLSLDASALEAYQLLAGIYYAQNRLEDARKEVEQAVTRQPRSVSARTMLAVLLEAQGTVKEAQKAYEQILAIDPEAAVAANNLAWLYAEHGGNLNTALELARVAKRRLPDRPEVSDTLGWCYYKKDLPDLAVPELRAAVALSPDNPEFHYHLGLALLAMGDVAGARQALDKALGTNPQFPGADEARRVRARIGG